jgi:hypothetical protein
LGYANLWDIKMRDDLQYDLCPGCGEKSPRGIIELVTHACAMNTVIYYHSSKFSLRQLHNAFTGKNELQSFEDLLQFEHLRAMPSFNTATEIEKRIYGVCRDSDIRTMKRLRAYIELERKFDASY